MLSAFLLLFVAFVKSTETFPIEEREIGHHDQCHDQGIVYHSYDPNCSFDPSCKLTCRGRKLGFFTRIKECKRMPPRYRDMNNCHFNSRCDVVCFNKSQSPKEKTRSNRSKKEKKCRYRGKSYKTQRTECKFGSKCKLYCKRNGKFNDYYDY